MPSESIQVNVRRSDWSRSAVLGDRGAIARDFADIVADRLVDTVLPWNQRETLIRTASERGITRFEANLIIAAVQNQLSVGRRRGEYVRRRSLMARIAGAVGIFLAVQAGIFAAAWYLLS
jgi:hypothetical protein